MLVLVTGATGFIGHHVCRELLERGHQVRALVRPTSNPLGESLANVETVLGDVTVPESLTKAVEGVEAVIHLAGVKQAGQVSLYHRVNTSGTRHMAEAVAGKVKHFVYMSTISAQGPSPVQTPHIDACNEAPINDYAMSKLEAERALAKIDVPATVLRPCVVYGPGDSDMLAWARLMRRRLAPLVPDLAMSFIHVEDLARACVDIVEKDNVKFGPYFLSDGHPITMSAFVDQLERLCAHRSVLRLPLSSRLLAAVIPALERIAALSGVGPFTVRRLHQLSASGWACLPNRAHEDWGFEPKRTLIEALPEVFQWYRDHGWIARNN